MSLKKCERPFIIVIYQTNFVIVRGQDKYEQINQDPKSFGPKMALIYVLSYLALIGFSIAEKSISTEERFQALERSFTLLKQEFIELSDKSKLYGKAEVPPW